MYPKTLPNHSTSTFRLEEKHNNELLQKAYTTEMTIPSICILTIFTKSILLWKVKAHTT